MAKAIVKCPYCEQSFDRNDPSIEWEKVGRRYAHKKCYTSHMEGMTMAADFIYSQDGKYVLIDCRDVDVQEVFVTCGE